MFLWRYNTVFLALSLHVITCNKSTVKISVHKTRGSILNLGQAKQHLRSPIKELHFTKNFTYEEVTATEKYERLWWFILKKVKIDIFLIVLRLTWNVRHKQPSMLMHLQPPPTHPRLKVFKILGHGCEKYVFRHINEVLVQLS